MNNTNSKLILTVAAICLLTGFASRASLNYNGCSYSGPTFTLTDCRWVPVVNCSPVPITVNCNPTTPTPNVTAVPEPSTIVAGALLLLPFGISTFRILRKDKQA